MTILHVNVVRASTGIALVIGYIPFTINVSSHGLVTARTLDKVFQWQRIILDDMVSKCFYIQQLIYLNEYFFADQWLMITFYNLAGEKGVRHQSAVKGVSEDGI